MNNPLKTMAETRGSGWLRIPLYTLLLFSIYRSPLTYLLGEWRKEDFTYCFMVPFIVLYLIREQRGTLKTTPSLPSWKGLIPIILGIGLYFMGELAAEYTTLYLSLWLVIVGLCRLHLGWHKLKIIAFPLAFSLASFTPPSALYLPLTFRLKLISSQLGVAMMQLYGLSAFREGNVIDLGFTKLQVVDACSGLRFVIPLFLMGLLLAYYYKAPLWKKLFLVLSTIPLSIFTNSLRIALVGILYQFFGAAAAEGFFHDFTGWFIFLVTLALLLLESRLLNNGQSTVDSGQSAVDEGQGTGCRERTVGGEESRVKDPKEAGDLAEARKIGPLLRSPQTPAAVILLSVTLLLSQGVNFRENKPPLKSFLDFPLQVGRWSGVRTTMEQEFLEALQLTDYAVVNYRDGQEKEVNLYVGYNGSQTKGKATHSPATCLPGNGWDFRESGTTELLPWVGKSTPMRVNRAFMEKSGVRQLVYYWFPQRGRILTNLYQVKMYNFWDAVTRQRTDGALVRLITPVYGAEQPAITEARLRGFAGEIAPLLDSYLPK